MFQKQFPFQEGTIFISKIAVSDEKGRIRYLPAEIILFFWCFAPPACSGTFRLHVDERDSEIELIPAPGVK